MKIKITDVKPMAGKIVEVEGDETYYRYDGDYWEDGWNYPLNGESTEVLEEAYQEYMKGKNETKA